MPFGIRVQHVLKGEVTKEYIMPVPDDMKERVMENYKQLAEDFNKKKDTEEWKSITHESMMEELQYSLDVQRKKNEAMKELLEKTKRI